MTVHVSQSDSTQRPIALTVEKGGTLDVLLMTEEEARAALRALAEHFG